MNISSNCAVASPAAKSVTALASTFDQRRPLGKAPAGALLPTYVLRRDLMAGFALMSAIVSVLGLRIPIPAGPEMTAVPVT
jgi:hypothetical protein